MIYLIFIIGLLLGSFYLVVGLRLPNGKNALNDRSECDHCKKKLKWYYMIPIFSYIFLKGKCAYCKKKISPLNIIIEISTGILFASMYHLYGFSYEFYLGIILASLLILICITDFKYFIILDEPLVISGILIIVLHLIYNGLEFTLYKLLAGIILFLILLGIKKIGDILFKKESLGGGDIKFSFIIGLTVGFQLSLFVLIISAFLALPTSLSSVMTTKNHEIPYGPFLVGALFIVYINMDKFIDLLNYIIA